MIDEVISPAPIDMAPTPARADFGVPLIHHRGRRMFKPRDARPMLSPLVETPVDVEDPNFNYYSVSQGTALRTAPFSDEEQTESHADEWPAETEMRVRSPKGARAVPRGGHLFFYMNKTSTNGKPVNPTENYSSLLGNFWLAKRLNPKTRLPEPGWASYPLRRQGR